MSQLEIRPLQPDDVVDVDRILEAAFEGRSEAELAGILLKEEPETVALVALHAGRLVGCIFFTSARIPGSDLRIAALGPMAVAPATQRSGVGSALVRQGLQVMRDSGYEASIVLGHSEYYPRFGFEPASRFGLSCRWPVPDDVFMAMELKHGSLSDATGRVEYADAFNVS